MRQLVQDYERMKAREAGAGQGPVRVEVGPIKNQ